MNIDAACKISVKDTKLFTDFSKCVICQTLLKEESILSITEKGFESFQFAVLNRVDETSIRLKELVLSKSTFFNKNPKFHRCCSKKYTNKKTVEQRKRAAEQSTKYCKEDAPSVSKVPRQSVDYKEVCFICERVTDRKGIYQKRLIGDFKRQTAVHRQAKLLKDDAVLTKIEGHGKTCKDLIAADFRYHQSCMNSFLGRSYSEAESVITPDNSVYDQAFIQLIQEIHEPLNQGQVFYTSDLCAKYRVP